MRVFQTHWCWRCRRTHTWCLIVAKELQVVGSLVPLVYVGVDTRTHAVYRLWLHAIKSCLAVPVSLLLWVLARLESFEAFQVGLVNEVRTWSNIQGS